MREVNNNALESTPEPLQLSADRLVKQKINDIEVASQYPQMVILFQAAQIERLTNTLASNRVLVKGQNRQMLDRHSYEIQVKELSRLVEQLRDEKGRLSQRLEMFKRKVQELEIQSGGRNGTGEIAALMNKYQRALLQIGKMYDDNTRLQQQINMLAQAQSKTQPSPQHEPCRTCQLHQQKVQALQAQLQALQQTHSQTVHDLRSSFDNQLTSYKNRITQKSSLQASEYSSQINQYKTNVEKLRNQLQGKDNRIFQLEMKMRKLQVEGKEIETRIRREIEMKVRKQIMEERAQASLVYSLEKPDGSVNSSYQLNTHNLQASQKQTEKLQNHIAMLSQQLQRLTQLVSQKSAQISRLQHQLSLNPSPQLHQQLLSLRLKYQSQLRKQSQQYNSQLQQKSIEISKYRQKMKEMENYIQDNRKKMEETIVRIKEEERKICEQVWEKKMSVVEGIVTQANRDRDRERDINRMQIDRLRTVIQTLQHQNQNLTSQSQLHTTKTQQLLLHQTQSSQQIKSLQAQLLQYKNKQQKQKQQISMLQQKQIKQKQEQWNKQKQYLQKLQQEERKYQNRLRLMDEDFRKDVERKIGEAVDMERERGRERERGLEERLGREVGVLRGRQMEAMERVRSITERYEANLKVVEKQYQAKLQNMYETIRQKDRQISLLHQKAHTLSNTISSQSQSQHNQLLQLLQHLKLQSQQCLQHMVHNPQLSKIQPTLSYLINQISTLSTHLVQTINSKLNTNTSLNTKGDYSQEYVRQLQGQCEDYLKIIMEREGKRGGSDRDVVHSIWEEIQRNNRYNREQWDMWRAVIRKQQKMVEQYYQDRYKWNQIKYQNQQLKHQLTQTKTTSQSHLSQIQSLTHQLQSLTHKNHTLQQKLSNTEQILIQKQQELQKHSTNLMKFNQQQQQEIKNMGILVQNKMIQIQELVKIVQMERKKYQNVRVKMGEMEEDVGKILGDMGRDWGVIRDLEQENSGLRAEITKLNQRLHIQRNEKWIILQKSKQHLSRLTQQLLSQPPTLPTPTPSQPSTPTSLTPLLSSFTTLQQHLHSLQCTVHNLQKQNYSTSTNSHVYKQFTHIKLTQLNRQIQRLIQENIELKDQIARCRLEMVASSDQEKRCVELLAMLVVVGVEVEALRGRVGRDRR